MPTMTYLQAISDAMREEMRNDERVFVMGEDIGVFGGAFKVTDGMIEEWRRKDPVDRQVRRLEAMGVDVGAVREEVAAAISAGVEEALAMPMPDPGTATADLFADEPALLEDGQAPWSGWSAA